MILTITARLDNPHDAWAFNQLSAWCAMHLAAFHGDIQGTRCTITINGDDDVLRPLIRYLDAHKEFYSD